MPGFSGETPDANRIISETDRHKFLPLYRVVLELLREQRVALTTVLKSVAGFGVHSLMHRDQLLRLTTELPQVIEVIDKEEMIQKIIPRFDELMQAG